MGISTPLKKVIRDCLYKKGKRRCTICRIIYPLSLDFFKVSKKKNNGFEYRCRKCFGKSGIRIFIIGRDKSRCRRCGLFESDLSFFDIDHIKPVFNRHRIGASFKASDIPNLQTLCPNCHRKKTLEDKRNGVYNEIKSKASPAMASHERRAIP